MEFLIWVEVRRPTLNVGCGISWAGVPGCMRKGRWAEQWHSLLWASWLGCNMMSCLKLCPPLSFPVMMESPLKCEPRSPPVLSCFHQVLCHRTRKVTNPVLSRQKPESRGTQCLWEQVNDSIPAFLRMFEDVIGWKAREIRAGTEILVKESGLGLFSWLLNLFL